jgi:acetyl-CoA/propionyl-CoA carboxylase biotin carboxyl carrier protein
VRKVLIANRGEIAVRILRACRDAGLVSVAVYAEPDLHALHVTMADEAYALGGSSAVESYLDVGKILKVAAESGADAVHPGYGFLAENADFAREVIAAGLTWIGPPPAAIDALGDKVRARHIARVVGAPLTPGTDGPVSGPVEVAEFVAEHGMPIAIKAAYGGGGRGLKIARRAEEITERFESAVREATAAFGRGECFVERYLDRPRHVETQCLADSHGNIVVVSTRDCSVQRRHQKLVEEAPAPFLTEIQEDLIRGSSKAILHMAGYVGAGTCEFLIGREGSVSFLEVNTRLQVEHPVTEEVTGIDLVREMFRIADGQALGYTDPPARGHSIEFRINAEDPGRNFMPRPGTIGRWELPSGPGVRVDAGYAGGMTVPQSFDSLIAKLIITGTSREQALERARRALAEFQVDGMPTVLPFHRVIVSHPAFTDTPFTVHTHWIDTDFDNDIPPYSASGATGGAAGAGGGAAGAGGGAAGAGDRARAAGGQAGAPGGPASPGAAARSSAGARAGGAGQASGAGGAASPAGPAAGEPPERERITVEVGGKRLEVVIPAGLAGVAGGGLGIGLNRGGLRGPGAPGGRATGTAAGRGRRTGHGGGRGGSSGGSAGGDALVSPMQGTIIKIVAAEGQQVTTGDTVVVLEAMKMEQPLTAHKDGTVTDLAIEVGQVVSAGGTICQLRD